MPSGSRYSSRRISPGCTGARGCSLVIGRCSMMVGSLNVFRVTAGRDEADAKAVIDLDRMWGRSARTSALEASIPFLKHRSGRFVLKALDQDRFLGRAVSWR